MLLLQEVGTEEGEGPATFGFVADAALDAEGRIYAIEPIEHKVAVFTPSGTFVQWIGRTGGGPGEMLSPAKLIIVDDTLVIYDRQLSRVSFFFRTGAFAHSFQLEVPILTALTEGPGGSLIGAVPGRAYRLLHLDKNGKPLGTFVPTPAFEARTLGNYVPEPGAACLQPDGTLVYANSWTYEIGGLDLATGLPK
jgi:hypothetical protein